MGCDFSVVFKKLSHLRSPTFFPFLSSRRFIVLYFTAISMLHFQLIFMNVLKSRELCLELVSCMYISIFSRSNCLREYIFFRELLVLTFLSKISWLCVCVCVSFFVVVVYFWCLFCSIHAFAILSLIWKFHNFCKLIRIFEVGWCQSSDCFSSMDIVLSIQFYSYDLVIIEIAT